MSPTKVATKKTNKINFIVTLIQGSPLAARAFGLDCQKSFFLAVEIGKLGPKL